MPNRNTWEKLIENLADIEHQRWADWQIWVHACSVPSSGGYIIPPRTYERWERQINTPYEKLSEQEKDGDREQVRRYLPLLESFIAETLRQYDEEVRGKLQKMKIRPIIGGLIGPKDYQRGFTMGHDAGYRNALDDFEALLSNQKQ